MNDQNILWSLQEDNMLLQLRDQRKMAKWSQIARILEEQFDVKGRNGKNCRERYQNHLNCSTKCQEWTAQDEKHLIELHNQKGNKWVEIARQLQRTDNSVKNHYHSRLRKSLRKINRCIVDHLRTSCKPFKNNILSRIVQSAQEYCCLEGESEGKEQAKGAFILKNKIINQAQLNQLEISPSQIQQIKTLATQITDFNNSFRKNQASEKGPKPASNKYKGKQIISLLSENINMTEMRLNSRRKVSHASIDEDESHSSEDKIVSPIKSPSQNSEEQHKLTQQTWTSMNNFIHSQPVYFFNENIFPYPQYCLPIFPQQESSVLFSGKSSSFTFYQSQKAFQGSTNGSMSRIDLDFIKDQRASEISPDWNNQNFKKSC